MRKKGLSMTTSKKILAYILNFFLAGFGFVMAFGWAGALRFIAYFIPFVVASVFFSRDPENPKDLVNTLSLVVRFVIIVLSYVHLYYAIKKSENI